LKRWTFFNRNQRHKEFLKNYDKATQFYRSNGFDIADHFPDARKISKLSFSVLICVLSDRFSDEFAYVHFDFSVWEPYFSFQDSVVNFIENNASAVFPRQMSMCGDVRGNFLFGYIKYPYPLALFQVAPLFVRLQQTGADHNMVFHTVF
jgi:hypothetical protein